MPRSHIVLVADENTGLISNSVYDASTQIYSENYEGSQSNSARFGDYTSKLIDNLASKHNLSGKLVMEIGCGDGAFLKTLCAKAECNGVGIDPVCRAGATDIEGDDFVVNLLAERLSHNHKKLKPDLIVCRHTLEHIADPVKFLQDIRAIIDNRPDVCLYLDVPDTRRIIDEGAFWDIYYEHAHYFTADSLEKTLIQSGFGIDKTSHEYEGQYLCVTARPDLTRTKLSDCTGKNAHTGNGSDLTKLFETTSNKLIEWKSWFSDNRKMNTVLWGGGSKAVSFVSTLDLQNEISAIVDIHPRKQGCYLPGSGHDVISPNELQRLNPDRVIVMNPAYLKEISSTLRSLDISPQLISVNDPNYAVSGEKTL